METKEKQYTCECCEETSTVFSPNTDSPMVICGSCNHEVTKDYADKVVLVKACRELLESYLDSLNDHKGCTCQRCKDASLKAQQALINAGDKVV